MNADILAAQFEQTRGAPLSAEEQQQFQDWEEGKLLHQIVQMPGWDEVVLGLFQGYLRDYIEVLATLNPAEHSAEKRLGAQATAYAAQDVYRRFLHDVERLLMAGRTAPQFLKDEIQRSFQEGPAGTAPLL